MFKPHIGLLANRVRKLIFVFKHLRHVVDTATLKNVYIALCQSILTYCNTTWGGCSKSHFITIERAQRALLKVATFKPILFPTKMLYEYCQVMSVRQLFVLHVVLKQHSMTVYNADSADKRNHLVVPSSYYNTSFTNKFFCFLGPFLYNNIHRILHIYSLDRQSCKKALTLWLLEQSYATTEELLQPTRSGLPKLI